MIDCLTSYIGLKRVNDLPTSDLYLNDLQGITTNQFDQIREIDENDGIGVAWTTLESRAIRAFESDLQFELKKFFQNYQVINSGITGFVGGLVAGFASLSGSTFINMLKRTKRRNKYYFL